MKQNRYIASKQRFVDECYDGNWSKYKYARRKDYLKVQLEWTIWMDNLLKSGEISQKTWQNAVF